MTRRRAIVPDSQLGDDTSQSEVELPSGEVVDLDAKNNEELTQLAASVIGVDPALLSVLDEDGNIQPPSSAPAKKAKVIATPNYGGKIIKTPMYAGTVDARELKEDLLLATNSLSYSEAFELRLLAPDNPNPFRAYLELFGKRYIVRVSLSDYPFTTCYPVVTFEQVMPPCPEHLSSGARHPNVGSNGSVCFGSTRMIPGTRITGFLNTLDSLLHNPNHHHGYTDACRRSA